MASATITATANDKYGLGGLSASYATTHSTYNYTSDGNYIYVGQDYDAESGTAIDRGTPLFDLSSYTGIVVTLVKLKMSGIVDFDNTAFTHTVYGYTQSSITEDTAGYTAYGSTSFGTLASSEYSTSTDGSEITLNAAGIAYVNSKLGGDCIFMLRSDRDVSETEPTAQEYQAFASAEYSTAANRPHLYIEYYYLREASASAESSPTPTMSKNILRTATEDAASSATPVRSVADTRSASSSSDSVPSSLRSMAWSRAASLLSTASVSASMVSTLISALKGMLFNDLGFNNYRVEKRISQNVDSSATPLIARAYGRTAEAVAASVSSVTRALDLIRSASPHATASAVASRALDVARSASEYATASVTALRTKTAPRAAEAVSTAIAAATRIKEAPRLAEAYATSSAIVWKGISKLTAIAVSTASVLAGWSTGFHLIIEGFTTKYAVARDSLYTYFKIRGVTKMYAKVRDALYGGRK